mgnify:FL=1
MKILQLSNKVPLPPRDGGSIASIRLSQGFVQLGHSLTILAMNTKKHFVARDFCTALAQKLSIDMIAVPVPATISPINAIFNLLFSRQAYTAQRFKSTKYDEELKCLLRKQEFDFIIIENLYPMLYLKTIRRYSSAKVIMRAHNIEHEIWRRTAKQANGIKQLYLNILANRIEIFEKHYINQYDFLSAITKRDETVLIGMGNLKPAMALPTGVDIDDQLPELIIPDVFSVAHLGALDWAPNQEGIIWFLTEVWPIVRDQHPDAEFHLAGRNAPNWFQKKIDISGVYYHGEVDSAEHFIQRFPIHVVPLWSGSGMRIKIIEAMTQGRVIVTTPIGIEGIEAINDKDVAICNTKESFASALIELEANPQGMKEMSQNAYTFVKEHYDNKKLLGDFISFLNDNANSI